MVSKPSSSLTTKIINKVESKNNVKNGNNTRGTIAIELKR